MSALHRKLLGAGGGGLGGAGGGLPPKPQVNLLNKTGASKPIAGRKRDYTPVSWSQYFDTFKDVLTDQNNHFRVYIKGNEGPVIIFLHGGGFSALSWSLLTSILHKQIICQCYSIDIRGHGDSQTLNDEDLSASTLAKYNKIYVANVINQS